MGPEEHDSVHSAGTASTGLFTGSDIAGQVEELEKRVAQQVIIMFYLCIYIYSVEHRRISQ